MTVKTDQTIIEELERENAALKARIAEDDAKYIGWLIETPIPYNGATMETEIRNGYGFVKEGTIFPQFVTEYPTEEQIQNMRDQPHKFLHLDYELAKIKKSEEVPSDKKYIGRLVSDFGYRATYYGKGAKDELIAKMKILDQQATEYMNKLKQDRDAAGGNILDLVTTRAMSKVIR